MPLRDRDRKRPRRINRLGIIRLGHREKRARRDGSEYTFPVQDDHFLLHDAPELREYYGDNAKSMRVLLLFPDIERNYDASYQVWAGGVCVCEGDGVSVKRAEPFTVTPGKKGRVSVKNAAGETRVFDGQAQVAFTWGDEKFQPGDTVPCPGMDGGLYPQCAACKIGGLLKVAMAEPDLFRLGYYQISTGSGRNYDSIMGTLELLRGDREDYVTGEKVRGSNRVSGIEMIMSLEPEKVTYQEGGVRKTSTKYFIKLEPSPEIVRALYRRDVHKMLGAPPLVEQEALPSPEPEVMDAELVEAPAPPPVAFVEEPEYVAPEAEEQSELEWALSYSLPSGTHHHEPFRDCPNDWLEQVRDYDKLSADTRKAARLVLESRTESHTPAHPELPLSDARKLFSVARRDAIDAGIDETALSERPNWTARQIVEAADVITDATAYFQDQGNSDDFIASLNAALDKI